jgi:hypothetical protein
MLTKKQVLIEAQNGKLTGLTPIGPGHQINAEAAQAYLEMVDAAKQDGISWKITDSYRPYEIQDKIFDWKYFKQTGKKRKKGTSGTPVAYPGKSNHGWGSAVDLKVGKGDPAYEWLLCNSTKFGFSNPFIRYKSIKTMIMKDDCKALKSQSPTEPWHWEHTESAKALKSGVTPMDSGADVTVPTSGDTTTSGTEPKKSGGIMDLLGGGGLNSWLDTFLPIKKGGEQKPKEEPINEEVDRIKELIKKVL